MRLRLNAVLNAIVLVSALGVILPINAHAHGDWFPEHGGVMNDDDEISFELVSTSAGVRLYVSDHGEPVSMKGGTPILTITRNGEILPPLVGSANRKNELDFQKINFVSGDKLNIKVTLPSGAIYAGRFNLVNGLPSQ